MKNYVKYKGKVYRAVDFTGDDSESLFKLKGLLKSWAGAEKKYIEQIGASRKHLESVIKNPEQYSLSSEYRDMLMAYSRLSRGFTH